MKIREEVLANLDEYLSEIKSKFATIADCRKQQSDNLMYFGEAAYAVERLYHLIHDLEDALDINRLLARTYSYAVTIESDPEAISLPVGNATQIFGSLQRSLRVFDKSVRLNLVNVLRGSTILCFNYSPDAYLRDFDFRKKVSANLRDFVQILSQDAPTAARELTSFFRKEPDKRFKAVRAFKGLTPILGSEHLININTEFEAEQSLKVSSDIRHVINHVLPSTAPKNVRVDWDNMIATGFIREINNVTKSFILFENSQGADESSALLKLHYGSTALEEYVLELFRKKATIRFEKESGTRRYRVLSIDTRK